MPQQAPTMREEIELIIAGAIGNIGPDHAGLAINALEKAGFVIKREALIEKTNPSKSSHRLQT